MKSNAVRYGVVAQAFHWVIVIGIIAQYLLADSAEEHEQEAAARGAGGPDAMGLHESIGMLLLLLAVLRLLWRLVDRRPAWPVGMKSYERVIARVMHTALYALLVAVPLAGWASRSAEGKDVSVFGLVTAPAIVAAQAGQPTAPAALRQSQAQHEAAGERGEGARGERAGEQYAELHEVLFNILVLLAVLHVLAGLKHHFVDKDGVLRSMSPRG